MINEMTITSILSYIEENIEITSINIDTLVQYSGYSRRVMTPTY